jgi:hypothetical protein
MAEQGEVNGDNANADRPIIELYVKAGVDHLGNGGCPMCHRYFLLFYVLRNHGLIDLVVTTVRPDDIPKEVKEVSSGKQFPIVRIHKGSDAAGQSMGGLVYDTVPEIEDLLDKFDCDEMASPKESRKEADAERLFQDLYRKFMFFLQDQGSASSINMLLERIDQYLKEQGAKFLISDTMCRADCYLTPTLQHIRIAGKYYKDYEIPTEYQYLWRYLHHLYQEAGVLASTPPDREIIRHYLVKATGHPAHKNHPTLLGDDRTLSTPEGVVAIATDD